jgi:hypothetical protein
MSISEKNNFALKRKKIAKGGMFVFSAAFVLSFLAGALATDKVVIDILGNISVFSALFFVLSTVCLFLFQLEAWERDWV